MRILLLGEYSNLHWTLASGLRLLGHEVVVASSGDLFKSYQNNIKLKRNGTSPISGIFYLIKILRHFSTFKGFDIVQIINPMFLDLKADKIYPFFRYIKKHNGKVFLGAFGDDYFWVKSCLEKKTFRYSEFDIPGKTDLMLKVKELVHEWIGSKKEQLNKQIVQEADGVIACLYEYYAAYKPIVGSKVCYIPAPINTDEIKFRQRGLNNDIVRFFIGIQKKRAAWKGADVMLNALLKVKEKYPDKCEIKKVVSIPYEEYVKTMNDSDVLLNQLYSYSPAMNALTAMAGGLVVVGGGEPEIYDILNEKQLSPIVNVLPTEEDIFLKLENIIQNKEKLPEMSKQSRIFVEKHHDYRKVAQKYIDFWSK